MLQKIPGNVKKIIIFIVILVLANLVASFLLGLISAMGSNIQLIGLSQVSFDPLITIAYMLLFYFNTLFYQPSPRAQYYLFLYTLFLSFTVPFIQGALFLVVFYFLLRKLKMI